MIVDIVDVQNGSLILIDEIEVGLHPKVQRRLIEVLYNISRNEDKQFIITSHSSSILSSLPESSRIFIEKSGTDFKAIHNISVNACLSKMDSASYPLFNLFCEDNTSERIILKAIKSIQLENNIKSFNELVNVITCGNNDETYNYFQAHNKTYVKKKIKVGYACILDGDQRKKYCDEEGLFFIFGDESPEKFLLEEYLKKHDNTTLTYHLKNSNPHCLFKKMIEEGIGTTEEEVFETCRLVFISQEYGKEYLNKLKEFIISIAKKYSATL